MITSSTDLDYQLFISNFKKKTGIDLSLYKEAQMKRRLTSLREKRGYTNFQDYFNALWKDEALFAEFLDRMTINVSEFFRNSSRWQVLIDKVIPMINKDKKIKAWSAACSTGEEPYTLSMILKYYFPGTKADILATDIDENVIRKAKNAVYTERSLKEVPEEILKKYFKYENNLYTVVNDITKDIRYKKQDLLIDQFETNFDLIICRNVIIYFTDEAKHKLYRKFSDSLRDGGVLFVGSTEQIFNPAQYGLETIDNFLYRKKG